jgi:hypothetical protein
MRSSDGIGRPAGVIASFVPKPPHRDDVAPLRANTRLAPAR